MVQSSCADDCDLRDIVTAIETDEQVKVVIFESAVDGFFLNHSDFLAKLEDLTNIPQGPTGLEAWPDILVWFFLIQPFPLPEHMIGRDAKFYLQEVFGGLNKTPGAIAPDVMNEYVREFVNPDAIHSTCEDFRAAADIDLEMDKADDEAGKKIKCPLHVLWGGKNAIGALWDVLATWREKCAASVTGRALDCGHFLQEERPQDLLAELRDFY